MVGKGKMQGSRRVMDTRKNSVLVPRRRPRDAGLPGVQSHISPAVCFGSVRNRLGRAAVGEHADALDLDARRRAAMIFGSAPAQPESSSAPIRVVSTRINGQPVIPAFAT